VPLDEGEDVFAVVTRPTEDVDGPVYLFVARDVVARHHPHLQSAKI
jgi:hypothetical protein